MGNVIEFLEANPGTFYLAFGVIAVISGIRFYLGGKKAEARFKGQEHQPVRFREKGASGHSKKSVLTRLGGASKVLEVVVTDSELWVKGIWPAFSYIGSKYDLTHRVPLESITSVQDQGQKVTVSFTNESGRVSTIELQLQKAPEFLSAIAA